MLILSRPNSGCTIFNLGFRLHAFAFSTVHAYSLLLCLTLVKEIMQKSELFSIFFQGVEQAAAGSGAAAIEQQ